MTPALPAFPHSARNAGTQASSETAPAHAASLTRNTAGEWALAGAWTVSGLGSLPQHMPALEKGAPTHVLNGQALAAFDSAGAWVLQGWLAKHAAAAELTAWQARWVELMRTAGLQIAIAPPAALKEGGLARLGKSTLGAAQQALDLLTFLGEAALVMGALLRHPSRMRPANVAHHVQVSGLDAMPIVGLMSFLLGVVVAYQGADQLRNYGANILVVDLVGYAMLREFAPLMTAIVIAGRSGSSFAAQIGTMVVTEEIDAMKSVGMDPMAVLVLPRVLALLIALPLLTVFADFTGVLGGMVMASSQLDINWHEFLDRFGREMRGSTLMVGLGKSVVFALVISVTGCFQGFRTQGSADSVGRQTTLSVVQASFVVIVLDAVFSVAFNILHL